MGEGLTSPEGTG